MNACVLSSFFLDPMICCKMALLLQQFFKNCNISDVNSIIVFFKTYVLILTISATFNKPGKLLVYSTSSVPEFNLKLSAMTNLLLCSLVNVVNHLPTMNTTKTLVRCQTMLIAFIAVFIIQCHQLKLLHQKLFMLP